MNIETEISDCLALRDVHGTNRDLTRYNDCTHKIDMLTIIKEELDAIKTRLDALESS